MNTLTDLTPAQQTARDVWTSGNYAEVADRLIRRFGPTLVEELDIQSGRRSSTWPAARATWQSPQRSRARMSPGLDITPVLLQRGAVLAAASGVDVTWVDGDAEDMPFADASFDVVTSAVGVMFCPSPRRPRPSSCGCAVLAARSGSSRGRPKA